MKRQLAEVRSAAAGTPLPSCLGKKCRQEDRCQLHAFGTPVGGLTDMPVDTPESRQRQRAIPDTTQRKLEGFCLNTPLTLSQAQSAETPTLGDGSEKHKAVYVQQQHQQQQQKPLQQRPVAQAHGQHWLATGTRPSHRRTSWLAAVSAKDSPAPSRSCAHGQHPGLASMQQSMLKTCDQQQQPCNVLQQQGLKQRRVLQASCRPNLLSPAASLRGPVDSSSQQATQECHQLQQEQGQELPSAVTPWCKVGEAAGVVLLCPGSGGLSEEGFVLHTSQSYSRVSQPAISPNVAAGLAAPADEEEDAAKEQFTTPSQDSKEPPQHSPSNITDISHDGLGDSSIAAFGQLQPQPPVAVAAPTGPTECSAAVPAVQEAADGEAGPSRFGSNTSSDDVFILPEAIAAAAAAVGAAGGALSAAATPGDSLALLLGDDVIGEATTPELELVCGASQEQPGSQPSGAAAAAAAGGARNSKGTESRGASARAGAAAAGLAAGKGVPPGAAAAVSTAAAAAGGFVLEEVTTKQVLFPIFRPKSTRKCVILVRHGESTYNKHDSLSKNWSDPTIFDAPLTQKGRLQCVAAREAVQKLLDKWGHMGSVLWLSSPLTRALETMTLVWPDVEHLAQQQGQTQHAQGRGRVAILSTIAEHCHTSGDVGVPASHLRQRWPSFASQLDELQEQWWHNPDPHKAPNCAVRRLFYRNERVDEMRHRVSEFTRWLGQQPEQVVVAFGHSTFWKYFSNSKSRMKNCEVRQMLW